MARRDVETAAAAAQVAVDHVRQPQVLPGTVTSSTPSVRLDGTSTDIDVTGTASIGDRVLVELRPDGTARITATI